MGDKQRAQYQCMNCGTIHWMEDPPDIDKDELYTKVKCKKCQRMTNHLWVGDVPEDTYLYYDLSKDGRYF
jgi:DNA-directed RNA polymerase subunit RPC12/RpoP